MDRILEIDEELKQLGKQEQLLISERRKLRCMENQSCNILDLFSTIQIG